MNLSDSLVLKVLAILIHSRVMDELVQRTQSPVDDMVLKLLRQLLPKIID
jgi:hypothetical protein